jgi:DNA-binding MarR family transcriptional regulator
VDLGEALGLTASGVTRGLVPLERIGLVRRDADARDARVAYAALTETGRERLAEMRVTAEQVAEEIFAEPPWTEEESAQLAGLLGRLGGTGFARRQPGGS